MAAPSRFLKTPSEAEYERRLRSRGTESEQAIRRRLAGTGRRLTLELRYTDRAESQRSLTLAEPTCLEGSFFPLLNGLLRAACPCASCRGGHENMKSEPDADVFDQKLGDSPATRIDNVVAVGS